MISYERRQLLLKVLREQPGLRTPELAQVLGVSEGTVRNDLNALEEEGALKRVHGGAVLNKQNEFQNNSFVRRYKENIAAKIAIAQEVAILIKDGDSIFLDASSTDFYLAREISGRRDLRVVTNGFEVARELADNPTNTVILIGGVVNNNSSSVTGLLSERILEEMSFEKTFLGCSGFSKERGMTEVLLAEAQIKRKVIQSSQILYGLVDSSKFGKEDMTSFARPSQIARLFTDSDVTKEWKAHLQEANIPLTVCVQDKVPASTGGR